MSEYLKSLQQREEVAYCHKKKLGDQYYLAKEKTTAAFIAKQKAADQRHQAKEELNKQYQAMMEARNSNRDLWDGCHLVCSYIGDSIDTIRSEADAEHKSMIECFKQANYEYEHGNKLAAWALSIKGYEHRDRRNTLNAEIKELYAEIKKVKQEAERKNPSASSDAFHAAKVVYDKAKTNHRAAIEGFETAKAERDRLGDEFFAAKAAHIAIKAELQRRMAEETAAECSHASSEAI